jgi:hypothetical protein
MGAGKTQEQELISNSPPPSVEIDKTTLEFYLQKFGDLNKLKETKSERIIVAGIHIGRRSNVCRSCYSGEELKLVRNPGNRYDKDAIKIIRFGRGSMNQYFGLNYGMLGFIPANIAFDISPKMKKGIVYRAFFEEYEESEGLSSYCNAYINLIEYKKIP